MPRDLDHQKALMDIDYSARLYELHARLYRRVKSTFLFLSLFSGTAVVASVVGDKSAFAIAASVLLAALPILETVIAPADKAAAFDRYRQRFLELKVRAFDLDATSINRELNALYAEPCDEIEALRRAAFNDNVRAYGQDEDALPLSRWQQLFHWLA